MLTSSQYEAVGRLAILFNEIDEILTVYLPLIPQYGGFTPPPGLGGEPTFNKRAGTFKIVLKLASEKDQIAAVYVSEIARLLERSLQLSAKRNELVHALAFMDFAKNERLLRTRKGITPPDEQLIRDLGSEAAFTAQLLAEKCEELLRYYIGHPEVHESPLPEY